MAKGRIVQILGGVVDVEFPADQMPAIYEAIEVPMEGDSTLVLEVNKHLGNNWVRCVAMDSTDGLQRGRTANSTGAPIMVPVGQKTLGSVFNVLGKPGGPAGPGQGQTSSTRSTARRPSSPTNRPGSRSSRPGSR